ncbi:hypothetical protein ABGB14_45150 [Nonomuraea sp. B10E15]|uniref:hypothetical protein n=1 Tax=Nonomuraea sp. B10E15 TaxID=3153560 RepID=UPI00325EA859
MRATSRPTFVFVHGGSSNSRAWGPLQNELALLGHRPHAVDLPGPGVARLNWRSAHADAELFTDRITPAVQDYMIRQADALTPYSPFQAHTLATSHVGCFSRPHVFAELLANLN